VSNSKSGAGTYLRLQFLQYFERTRVWVWKARWGLHHLKSLHQQRSRRSLQKSNLAFFFLSKWAPFPVTNLPPIEHQFAVLRAPRTTEQRTDRDHLFNPINTIPSTNHRQRDRIQQSSTAVPFRSSSTRESLNTEIDANTDPQ
jgi:hypothetical protein